MFYPPEGPCRAEPEGGPIVFTFHFIGVDNGTGIINLEAVFCQKKTLKKLYLMGRMGRVGRVGRYIKRVL